VITGIFEIDLNLVMSVVGLALSVLSLVRTRKRR
jgi:hypothetical protein